MKRQRNGDCNSLKVHVKFEADLTTMMGKKRGVIKEDQVGNTDEEECKRNEISPASSMCSVGAATKAAEGGLLWDWDEQENYWPWLSRGGLLGWRFGMLSLWVRLKTCCLVMIYFGALGESERYQIHETYRERFCLF